MRGVKWNKLTDRMLYQSLFSDIEINHEDIKLDFKLLDVLWGDSTNSKFVNETVTSSNVAEPAISNRKDKSSGCITVDQLQMFQKTLHGEEYDSESIEFDVEGNRSESNIFMIHRPFYDTIKKFIHYNKLHGNTFNVGYRFYYWKYYEQVVDIQQSQNNQNDHGGYKVSELFVKTKYKNIKDEILNNQIYTLNSVELDQSLTKADQYINTERVKETIASPHRSDATIFKYSRAEDIDRDKTLHYGIIKGTSLTYEHILCVIFYTDWSELSRQFSSTFRKAKIYQSLSTVKRKNSEFAIWSKLLREVVEIFGYSSIGEQIDYNKNKWINKLQGPFFCGMDFAMVIPEYDLRLCGPTSTSRQIAVATRFAGNNGIIIQVNNISFANQLTAFDCCWVSTFAGEDEYLFIGGQYTIKLESIRLKKTKQNFQHFFQSLHKFDCMFNGKALEVTVKHSDRSLLSNLILYITKHKVEKQSLPQYIKDTFEAYINHKAQVVLNLDAIDIYFRELSDLVMTFTALRPTIFNVFKNLTSIVIYTSEANQFDYLELFRLLSTNKSAAQFVRKEFRIRINAKRKQQFWINKQQYSTNPSWISSSIASNELKLTKFKQLNIKLHEGTSEDNLIVTRYDLSTDLSTDLIGIENKDAETNMVTAKKTNILKLRPKTRIKKRKKHGVKFLEQIDHIKARITINEIKKTAEEYIDIILTMKFHENDGPKDIVEAIRKIVPNEEHMSKFNEHFTKSNYSVSDVKYFAEAEKLWYYCRKIPEVSLRVEQWMFKLQFDELCHHQYNHINLLRDTYSSIMDNRQMYKIFELILVIGNYLNYE
eukprot:357952_1